MDLKGNQSTSRAINRRLVLDQLRNNGSMSRAAIASVVKLSPAAISFVTSDLIDEGLVVETTPVSGATGRRPIPLNINYAVRFSVGLKVMFDRLEGALTDLSMEVLNEVSIPLSGHTPDDVIKAGADATDLLIEKAGIKRSDLIGVGIAISGHVDAEAGVCRCVPRFGWEEEVPLAAMLANVVSVPVWIENDSNAFAISEQLFGRGRGMQNIVCVAMGRGIGAGIIINGQVHRGTSGAAGEFGHNFEERGRRCECGRDGCLETYCSDQGLILSWQLQDPSGCGETPEALKNAADAGDLVAVGILRNAGIRLGHHIAALVNTLDPTKIIFGAEGVRFGEHLFGPLQEVLAEVCHPGVPMIAFDMDDTGWTRGAAALAIRHFFNFEATGGHTSETTNQLSRNRQFGAA